MPRRVLRTVAVRTKGEEIRFENLSVAHARSAVAEIRAKDHVVCGGIGVSCRGNHADAGLLEHVAHHAAGKSILHSEPLMVLQNRIDESHARFTVASGNFSCQKNGYLRPNVSRPIRRLKKGSTGRLSPLVRLEVVNPPYSNTPLSSRKKALRSGKKRGNLVKFN